MGAADKPAVTANPSHHVKAQQLDCVHNPSDKKISSALISTTSCCLTVLAMTKQTTYISKMRPASTST